MKIQKSIFYFVLILYVMLLGITLTTDKLDEKNGTEIIGETEKNSEYTKETVLVHVDTKSKYSLFGNDYMGHISKCDYEKYLNGSLDEILVISNGFGDYFIRTDDINSINIPK